MDTKKELSNKKWWMTALVLMFTVSLAVGMVACGDSNDSGSNGDTESQQNQQPDEGTGEIQDSENITDLPIGTSATVNGVTVTVNSVTPGEPAVLGDTLEVSITYVNNSGKSLSITPYDWKSVQRTGSSTAHVGGDKSFHLDNIADGKEWTGIVTLWDEEGTEKILFDSSSVNRKGDDKEITWVLE